MIRESFQIVSKKRLGSNYYQFSTYVNDRHLDFYLNVLTQDDVIEIQEKYVKITRSNPGWVTDDA